MRTTITLDPDVEQLIKTAMREQDITFKDAVNDALRAGFRGSGASRPRRFKQRTFSMGAEQNVSIVKALQLAGALEDAETMRKMALDK
jgi:Arc/MetJ family transcription regulator